MDSTPEDLWQASLNRLPDDVRTSLALVRCAKYDVLAAVIQAAETKRQESLKKRWRLKIPSGKEIDVRDVLGKIIKWVDRFKQIGDNAVTYDPAHMALPWAVIRFLLQAAVNDVELFSNIAIDLEVITRFVARYKIFESLHLRNASKASGEIRQHLVALYAEVLKYLAGAVTYLHEPTVFRILKSPFRVVQDDRLKGVFDKQEELARLSDLASFEKVQNIEEVVIRLADHTAASQRSLKREKRTLILNWLSTVPYSKHHRHHCRARTPGTGQWLLHHPTYYNWQLASYSSILHIHGMPGCGKTKLCSTVIDSRLRTPQAAVAFFYCDVIEAEPARKDYEEVLRSIIRQLSVDRTQQSALRDEIQNEYERQASLAEAEGFDVENLTADECVRLILDIAEKDSLEIILDGVDVLDNFHSLLKSLNTIIERASSVVKILVFSRNEVSVIRCLPNVDRIHIDKDAIRDDVSQYINAELSRYRDEEGFLGDLDSAIWIPKIADALLQSAEDMFLLVELQLKQIRTMKVADDMISHIKDTRPKSLDDHYVSLIDTIQRSGKKSSLIARSAFSWLIVSKEHLRSKVFMQFVTQQSARDDQSTLNTDTLIQICEHLIQLDTQFDCFRFRHQTVRDFLLSQESFGFLQCETLVAEACLQNCLMGPPEQGVSPDLNVGNSYTYSALYWAHHLSLAAVSDKVSELANEFILSDGKLSIYYLLWQEFIEQLAPLLPLGHAQKVFASIIPCEPPSVLFAASTYGLTGLLEQVDMGGSLDWHQQNNDGHTGLYIAAGHGRLETVRLLLRHDVGVDIKCGKHGTALRAACFRGHLQVVDVLLQRGASTETLEDFSNAYEAACNGGSEEIALLLVHRRLDIDNSKATRLVEEGASRAGYLRVIQWLEKRQSLSESRATSSAYLKTAISSGSVKLLQRTLTRTGISKPQLPEDGLSMAVIAGKLDMLEFLLHQGLSLESSGPLGSPLRTASLLGQDTIARVLIEHGAQIQTDSPLGDALQAAAMRGNCSIIELLLNRGVSVNFRTGYFGNALQAAAYFGHLNAVKILLEAGADVSTPGLFQNSASAASRAGHFDVVSLLLERLHPSMRSSLLMTEITYSKSSIHRTVLEDMSPASQTFSHFEADTQVRYTTQQALEMTKRHSDRFSQRAATSEIDKLLSLRLPIERPRSTVEEDFDVIGQTSDLCIFSLFQTHPECFDVNDKKREAFLFAAIKDQNVITIKVCVESFCLDSNATLRALQHASTIGNPTAVRILMQYALRMDQLGRSNPQALLIFLKHSDAAAAADLLDHIRVSESREVCADLINQALVATAAGGSIDTWKLVYSQPVRFTHASKIAALHSACVVGSALVLYIVKRCFPGKKLITKVISDAVILAATHGHCHLAMQLLDLVNVTLDHRQIREAVVRPRRGLSRPTLQFFRDRFSSYRPWRRLLQDALQYAVVWGGCDYVRDLLEELDLTGDQLHNVSIRDPARINVTQLLSVCINWAYPGSLPPYPYVGPRKRDTQDAEAIFQTLLNRAPQSALSQDLIRYLLKRLYQVQSIPCIRSLIYDSVQKGIILTATAHPECFTWALQVAAARNDLDFADLLLASGTDPNHIGHHYGTASQAAARFGHVAMLRKLIAAGSKTLPRHGKFGSPLYAAILGKHRDAVELLLEEIPDVEAYCNQLVSEGHYGRWARLQHPLAAAISRGYVDISLMLLCASPWSQIRHFEVEGLNILIAACKMSSKAIIDRLLMLGADATISNPGKDFSNYDQERQDAQQSALHMASYYGSVDIVETLIGHGALKNFRTEFLGPAFSESNQTSSKDASGREHDEGFGVESRPFGTLASVLEPSESNTMAFAADPNVEIMAAATNKLLRAAGTGLVEANARLRRSSMVALSSPVGLAAAAGHVNVVQSLINAGVDLSLECWQSSVGRRDRSCTDKPDSGYTALGLAAKKGHLQIIELLLRHGCPGARSAIQGACYNGHVRCIEFLFDHLASRGEVLEVVIIDAMKIAKQQKYANVVDLLLEYRPPSFERLLETCAHGSVSRAIGMLSSTMRRPLESSKKAELLVIVARELRLDLLKLVLRAGAAPRDCETSPLAAAFDTVRNAERSSAIRFYDQLQDYTQALQLERVVRELLESDADSNDAMEDGSVLHAACYLGNKQCVRLLLEHGATIDPLNNRMQTPLATAIERRHKHVWRYLMDNGANLTVGRCLHAACLKGDTELVTECLDSGADANEIDADGSTPFALIFKSIIRADKELWTDMFISHAADIVFTSMDLDAVLCSNLMDKNITIRKMLRHTPDIKMSQSAMENLLMYCDLDLGILQRFKQQLASVQITPRFLEKVKDKALRYLLQCQSSFKASNEHFISLQSVASMKIVFEHDKTFIPDNDTLRAILTISPRLQNQSKDTESLLSLVFQRMPDAIIDPQLLEGASSESSIRLLLQHCPIGFRVTNKLLTRLERNLLGRPIGTSTLSILLEHAGDLQISEDAAVACLDQRMPSNLALLLKHDAELEITKSMFWKMFGMRVVQRSIGSESGDRKTESTSTSPDAKLSPNSCRQKMVRILQQYNKKVKFDRDCRKLIESLSISHELREELKALEDKTVLEVDGEVEAEGDDEFESRFDIERSRFLQSLPQPRRSTVSAFIDGRNSLRWEPILPPFY